MKITFKVEYTKKEKREEGRSDIEVIVDDIDTSVRHPELTQYFYGFLTTMGYILSIENFEGIDG